MRSPATRRHACRLRAVREHMNQVCKKSVGFANDEQRVLRLHGESHGLPLLTVGAFASNDSVLQVSRRSMVSAARCWHRCVRHLIAADQRSCAGGGSGPGARRSGRAAVRSRAGSRAGRLPEAAVGPDREPGGVHGRLRGRRPHLRLSRARHSSMTPPLHASVRWPPGQPRSKRQLPLSFRKTWPARRRYAADVVECRVPDQIFASTPARSVLTVSHVPPSNLAFNHSIRGERPCLWSANSH